MSGIPVDMGVLPGVRRHVRSVREDLARGRSCVWVLPSAMTEPQRFGQLLDMVGEQLHVAPVEPPPAVLETARLPLEPTPVPPRSAAVVGTMEEMLAAVFASDTDGSAAPEPQTPTDDDPCTLAHRVLHAAQRFAGVLAETTADPLLALASLRVPGGVTVVISADAEHDRVALSALMRQYPALARDQQGGAVEQPLVLVAGSPAALPDVEHVDPLTTAVHWWWGVFGRLDLLTVAAVESEETSGDHRKLLEELCPDLVPEVIAEVAGPDIDLAVHLARRWDGTTDHLARLVDERDGACSWTPADEAGRGPAGARPPRRLWEMWSAGRVDTWGGRVREALGRLDERRAVTELAERLWIGQARALNPLLDELRRAIVHRMMRDTPAHTLAELDRRFCGGAGVESIELNDLRNAATQRVIVLERRLRELLDHAVGARNGLAHRKCVDDRRLRQMERLSSEMLSDPCS